MQKMLHSKLKVADINHAPHSCWGMRCHQQSLAIPAEGLDQPATASIRCKKIGGDKNTGISGILVYHSTFTVIPIKIY